MYESLSLLLAPISFHAVRVRVADALLLLPFLDFFGLPGVIGLTIGCAVANALSPFGVVDVAFGCLANFVAGSIAWTIGRSKGVPALLVTAALEALVVSCLVGYFILHLFGSVDLLVALGLNEVMALVLCTVVFILGVYNQVRAKT
ncbi:MAG: QueT transporter family protein [Desulfurococcaceae archaeon]